MKKISSSIILSLLLISACNTDKTDSRSPNVIIFFADDFGWGDLSINNKDPFYFRHTPNLDELFTNGVRLENYVTHCVCSPSRAGLLTGLHYAKVHSGPETGGTLPNHMPNIAKDFQAAGYKTGAFGKWHNGMPNFPEEGDANVADFDDVKVWNELYQLWTCDLEDNIFTNTKGWEWGEGVNAYGFDRWVGYHSGGGDLFSRFINWHHEIDWWHDRSYVPEEKGYTTDLITKHAMNFIQENSHGPFFCYIPHEAVHGPVQVKLEDLKELCAQFPGEWDYVRNIVSPRTGNRLEDIEELRCESGAEFDLTRIDPEMEHFTHLIYATYVYSLDKSVGKVIQKVKDLGQLENTIFLFASDNGATPRGCNLPFKGGKHSLWDGGVHVPAAIWWPGHFDKNTKPYAPGDNKYEGFIGYIDMYPTLMSMTGNKCNAVELDGIDSWTHLQKRTNPRPGMENPIFWMWRDHGSVRTERWKLMYSESGGRNELYDLHADVGETTDVSDEHPEIEDALIALYKEWLRKNNFAMSYVSIPEENIFEKEPQPDGDILEIRAVGKDTDIGSPIYIKCMREATFSKSPGQYIQTGDRLEYDIYVCEDSDFTSGMYISAARGPSPYYNSGNGINQFGELVQNAELVKGEWTRQVVGLGNLCPGGGSTNYISLVGSGYGNYHFYLDNVVIRKKDGSLYNVIWDSEENLTEPSLQHGREKYGSIDNAIASEEFPLEELSISVVKSNK